MTWRASVLALCVAVGCGDDGASGSDTSGQTTQGGSDESSGSDGSTVDTVSATSTEGGATPSSGSSGSGGTVNGTLCDDADDCDPGFSCVTDGEGEMFCAASCTPFDGVSDCDDGWFCVGLRETEGNCFPATAMGTDYEDDCAPQSYACADDRVCQTLSAAATICVDLCRLSMADADCPPMWQCLAVFGEEVGACTPTG